MSSTTLLKSSPAQPPASIKPAIPAISLLDTPIALPVTIAHALLLSGLFAWQFDSLVENPVSTLQISLPVVAVLQIVHAVLAFPVVGSQGAKVPKKSRPGEKKRIESRSNVIVASVLSLLLAVFATPVLHLLLVLFGAPFVTHIPHTFLCCAHISVLAIFPVFFVRGIDGPALPIVIRAAAPLDQTFGGLVGTIIGAWLGAVPIPLDWDREWQKWPVTIVTGAYMGYLIGSKVLGTVFHGKAWSLSEEEIKEE